MFKMDVKNKISASDPAASAYVEFWSTIRHTSPENRSAIWKRAQMRKGKNKNVLRRLPLIAESLRAQHLSERHIAEIERQLYWCVLWDARQEETRTDYRIERIALKGFRKIQTNAWKSIAQFEKARANYLLPSSFSGIEQHSKRHSYDWAMPVGDSRSRLSKG